MLDYRRETCREPDPAEAALLGLTEVVTRNSEAIAENSRKLDAIIKHLQVPYERDEMGVLKNRPASRDD